MELRELMRFARSYNALGWAVQAQVDDIVDGNLDDINVSALEEIDERLRGYHEDLDEAIDAALEEVTGT